MSIDFNNSNLTKLMQCGERFRRSVIEKEARPGTIEQYRGTAVHAVAAESHTRQMKATTIIAPQDAADRAYVLREALPSLAEAGDLAAEEFDRKVGEGIRELPEEMEAGVATVRGQEKDAAVDLARMYVRDVAPTIDPIAVERKVVVKPRDSDLVVYGTMDLVTREPSPSVYARVGETIEVIRDQKTGTKTPPGDTAHKSQQLDMYSMLRKAETGTMPGKVTLDYLIRTPKRGEVKHIRLDSRRTDGDVGALVNKLNVAVEAVRRGVFVPNTNGWWCDVRYCEFFQSCQYVSGRRKGNE